MNWIHRHRNQDLRRAGLEKLHRCYGATVRDAIADHDPDSVVECDTCGLVQSVGPVPAGASANCARCGFRLFHRLPNSRVRTLAFSVAAAILYFPANFYPLVTAEYHGHHSETTVYQRIRSLFVQH